VRAVRRSGNEHSFGQVRSSASALLAPPLLAPPQRKEVQSPSRTARPRYSIEPSNQNSSRIVIDARSAANPGT